MRVILIYAFRELSGAPYLLDSFISSVFAVSEAYRVGAAMLLSSNVVIVMLAVPSLSHRLLRRLLLYLFKVRCHLDILGRMLLYLAH